MRDILKEFSPLRPNIELSNQMRLNILLEHAGRDFIQVHDVKPSHTGFFRYFDKYITVNPEDIKYFLDKFGNCIINGNELVYDDLINICIMVKNAGPGFRDILVKNLPFADRWTILDTGSTDDTVQIAREVLAGTRYEIYQEPFLGFRLSRNRLLDLAGKKCVFNIMLDDTYFLNGNIREFLHIVRSDQVADSFSLVIENIDTQYTSNRITRSDRGLRYVGDMHEIIQTENNFNAQVPYQWGFIRDVDSEYMKTRTTTRKLSDIETLMRMQDENPEDPRNYYYIADSYICLKDWKKAEEWFRKRASMPGGNRSEIQDALYYIAVINHMFLGKPWNECHDLYLKCYEFDPTRAETLYFVGKHYLDEGMTSTAFMYLKHAFSLGFPAITMSIRKNIYNYHLPRDLMSICYDNKDYKLGQECADKVLAHDPSDERADKWRNTFTLINSLVFNQQKNVSEKKVVCFVVPGGWKQWDGETPLKEGLGGSEVFCIGYAESLSRMGYNVMIFCNCLSPKIFRGVNYIPITEYISFINTCQVDVCIISRYSEYIPATCLSGVPKVYFLMHDLPLETEVIPLENNLNGILCVSDWHKQYFTDKYPKCTKLTTTISHGIDMCLYRDISGYNKIRYKFIYSSFPNRGLKHLLEMFPKIRQLYPTATLDVFSDTRHPWVQKHHKKQADEIEVLMANQKNYVINHGWVSPQILRQYWSLAHVWLYPCIFPETACLTAYEAAASKTLVVTNNNAGLAESVGDRGLVLYGNPSTLEWQDQCVNMLKQVLDTPLEQELIRKNYEWVSGKDYQIVVEDFDRKYLG